MTIAEVEELFRGYADAFTAGDVGRVCGYWAFPAFLAARGKRAALDEPAFHANTESLCRFYEERGVARAEKRLLAVDEQFPGLAFVRTADRLLDGCGNAIAEWEHGYLVSATDSGLKLIAAMPDGELSAWERNGTPLGSW